MQYTWKIGGEAGFGIMTTGLLFSKIAARRGHYIFDFVEYPSLIRGGHNAYEVNVSDEPVSSVMIIAATGHAFADSIIVSDVSSCADCKTIAFASESRINVLGATAIHVAAPIQRSRSTCTFNLPITTGPEGFFGSNKVSAISLLKNIYNGVTTII
ncbi:MAG: 2-oxoacid:acceptor oxidoreductase family protein [Candidatus Roizmanbacteria bacterium]|nr:2-oxoacid:acceptor oxidoreductase family protein [Candidatus Roizmanbacteria bacterium]